MVRGGGRVEGGGGRGGEGGVVDRRADTGARVF